LFFKKTKRKTQTTISELFVFHHAISPFSELHNESYYIILKKMQFI